MLLLLVLGPAAADDAQTARTAFLADGGSFQAAVTAVSPEWSIKFETPEGSQTIAAADIARWGDYQDSFRGTQIHLSDGSVLVADVLEMDDARLQIYGDVCSAATLRLSEVRGIVFDPPIGPLARDELIDRIFSVAGAKDQLLFENGDTVAGSVQGLNTSIAPSGEPVTSVALATEEQDILIPIEKVAAVVFGPGSSQRPSVSKTRATLGFSEGTLLHVERQEDRRSLVDLHLAGGVRLQVDPKVLIEELTLVLPRSPRVTYLSEFPTLVYKQVPLLDTSWPLGRDRNVSGGSLRSRGRLHLKGLGMHATSRVALALDGSSRRFQAEVSLDDQAGHQGSVVFRVFILDATGRWQRAYESPIVRGQDGAQTASVDLSGARSIALIVDAADRGDVLDHANWLYARLLE